MKTKEIIYKALQDLYSNDNNKLQMDELYNLMISNNSQYLIDNVKHAFSVCGAQIIYGQLSFQCFDCSKDPNHMICVKCFDIKKHINHKYNLKDNSGCCDCGDENCLKLGICDHHQGYANINKWEIISKIPEEIQINTFIFINCLNKILNDLYVEIKPMSKKIPFYIKIYHIAVEKKLTKLIEAINLKDYYEKFCKALYFHNLLIDFISWFIKVNHENIFLMTQILQQNDENTKQIILQNIFDRQLMLESLGPYRGQKIEQIFYAFHADDQFKQLVHITFMNNYQNFHSFIFVNKKVFESLKYMYEDLQQNFQEMNNINLQTIDDKAAQQINQLRLEQNENDHNLVYIYISYFRGQHTQFCPQQMIETFFLPQNFANYLTNLIECQNIYYQDVEFLQEYYLIHLNLLKFRIECKWLKNALMNSFKQLLDDQFDTFQENYFTKKNEYEDFYQRQFILPQLIYSFCNVKKQFNKYQFYELGVQEKVLIDASIIMNYQSLQLNIINNMIKGLRSIMPKLIGKRNLSRVILYQCYLKLNQDKNDYNIFEQIDKFHLDHCNPQNNPLQKQYICDLYNKLSLRLLKRPIVANLIFIELLILEYFESQFFDKQKFLKYLMQILLIQNINELKELFNYILIDSLQNFITFNLDQSKRIYIKYSNINSNSVLMESIDLAYIKLYLYLFENDGLQYFDQTFRKFRIPDTIQAYQIYNTILLFIITSDLEFWNVLQMVEQTIDFYPNQLKYAINFSIINIFNQSSSLSFTEIQKYIQQLKIHSNQSIQNFVQQVCQLDQISKKFTLKKDIQLFFDPILFFKNNQNQGQLFDKLIDQRKSQGFINFGNYIQERADNFITQTKSNVDCIFFDIFILLANKPFINNLIKQIQQQQKQTIQTYQLLYYLIIVLSKELNKVDEEIFEQIQLLASNQNNQNAEYLNQIIDNLKQLFETGSNIQQQQNNIQKTIFDKSKIKNIYLQKQTKFNQQLDISLQLELPKQEYNENDYCQSCKLLLENADKYTPILIQTFAKQNLYETMPTKLHNLLNTEGFNLLNISSCKHQFHEQCLINSNKGKFQLDLPMWLSSLCPICQQSCNILFPMSQLEIHFDQFIKDLEAILVELNLDQQLQKKYKDNEDLILIDVCYQLLITILIQIFVQSLDFQRSGKIQIFQQFLKILIYLNNNNTQKKSLLKFEEGQFFILDIMLLIEIYVMKQISKKDFEYKIQQVLFSLPIQNTQIVQTLFSCFEINVNEQLLKNEQNKQQLNCITDFYQIKNEISSQITIILGDNFEIFRKRYISNLCKKCNFFNNNFKNSKDIALCLLCLKTFCIGSCLQQQFGNLSIHVEEEHNGHSIYVCLSSGKVVITAFPISLINCFTLYYNNLGQELGQLTFEHLNWDDYKLDKEKVDQISKIILQNQYQHIVRNALNDKDIQNIRRNI